MKRALLLALLALPSCLVLDGEVLVGSPVRHDAFARIVPGVTTKAEVLRQLGPPNEYRRPDVSALLGDDLVRLGDALSIARRAEDVLTWQQDRVTAGGTWLVFFTWTTSRTESDLLVVFFDADDVVKDVASRAWSEAP